MQRWGTERDQRMDDKDYLDQDDEDDEYEDHDMLDDDDKNNSKDTRHRMVRPQMNSFQPNNKLQGTTFDPSQSRDYKDPDAILLQRVRRNQERMQSPITRRDTASPSLFPKDSKTGTRETSAPSTFFFRPQDDNNNSEVERSPSSRSKANENDKTTRRNVERDFNNEPSSSLVSSKQAAATKEPRYVPLTNEQGQPLYLTTKQAQINFDTEREQQQAALGRMADSTKETTDKTENEAPQQVSQHSSLENDNLLAVPQTWQDIGITHPILLHNLQTMNCPSPLSVQAKACPDILQGTTDLVLGTYTGSGKTLAFLVPLIQRFLLNERPGDAATEYANNNKSKNSKFLSLLIVAPGRELASQIGTVARQLVQGTDYTVLMAIGGTTFARNVEQIRKRKPAILVGTPGRVAELVVGQPGSSCRRSSRGGGGGRLTTSSLQAFVLDEFDALLQYKPHAEPTLAILETLQRRRQQQQNQPPSSDNNKMVSIFCSATASDVLNLPKVKNFLDPNFVLTMADEHDAYVTSAATRGDAVLSSSRTTVPPPRVSKTVMHGVVHVAHRRFVLETVRRILHTEPYPQQVLIFVQDSRKVEMMVERLGKMGILAAPLHGGRNSEKLDRAEVNKALREGQVGIVVATELAARGLDAPLLTHVINVDLPTDASHYAHRAGRCGRGGRPGVVLNLTVDPKERKVPHKLTQQLGVPLFTVQVGNGKLNLVVEDSSQKGEEQRSNEE